MVHRGPDGAGVWVSDDHTIGMGHRRLSIIDLSAAASQPMSNEDGTILVVFNGEIYNHEEIRAQLAARGGHRWRTDHSDTEVIIHAFEEWGIDCVERFRGMFAIALWDVRRRQLWLIRDRIGIKPLYYSTHHNRLTFASEIKALLQDPQQVREVCDEAFFHYLSFLATPAPHTLFNGILKLPPSTWMRVDPDGTTTQQRYWDMFDAAKPLTNISDDELGARLLEELRVSVKLRKISDVPVGVFLSGGIDSSTNAVLFSEGETSRIKTFSIAYQGEYETYRNELQYARLVAKQVNAEHREIFLSEEDFLGFLPEMVRYQDEPIADATCVPVYYLSKLARDNGVIVCQVGEGADELFWGYQRWKLVLDIQQRLNSVPRFVARGASSALAAVGQRVALPTEWTRRVGAGQPVFWGGAEMFTQPQKQRLLSRRMREQFNGYTSWEALRPIHDRFVSKSWHNSALNWMTYLDLNFRLPELLLMKMDKMSMAASLEGRVPFLDHKFVEFAMSIPQATKTRNGTLKYVLKNAVRGLIPDEVIDRPKQGFGVPVFEWFLDKLGAFATEQVEGFCNQTDLLDGKQVAQFIREVRQEGAARRSSTLRQRFPVLGLGMSRGASQVWLVLNCAMWWHEYLAQKPSVAEGLTCPAI